MRGMDGNRKSQMKRSRKGQEGRDKSQRGEGGIERERQIDEQTDGIEKGPGGGGVISPRKGAVLSLCLLETVSVLLLLFLDLTVNCY